MPTMVLVKTPQPALSAFLPFLPTVSSHVTAAAKAPMNIPQGEMKKTPRSMPMREHHTPAFDAPYRFAPTMWNT